MSSWLTTLPIPGHGFALSKGEFHDALCLQFGWQPVNLPQTCVCGKSFSVEHVPLAVHVVVFHLFATMIFET